MGSRKMSRVMRQSALFLVISFFCLSFARGQEQVDLLIVGGQRFDTERKTFIQNEGIAIKDRRFVRLGSEAAGLSSREKIQLNPGQFVLPGIVDCHAHYNVRLIRKRREEFEVMPILYLANGATVTFSCGEFDPEGMYRLRRRIEKGEQIGPKLLNSGPYFGRARPGWARNKSAQEIREEVDFWAGKGVGGFKAKSIDPNSLKVLIEQAHTHGLTVTGHLDSGYRGSVNPRDAVSMGIDRIEHFLGGDAMPNTKSAYQSLQNIKAGTKEYEEIVKHFIDNGVFFDATLTAYGYLGIKPGVREEYGYWVDESKFCTAYMQEIVSKRKPMRGMEIYQRIYDAKLKTIAAFHEAGGAITLGTDHVSNGNHMAGFGVHREMDALVRAGIPANEAILIATINGARALKIEKDHGSIDVGKFADLFVITGDPSKEIRKTRNVETVICQGRKFDAVKLLESVRGKLGPASKEEEKDW